MNTRAGSVDPGLVLWLVNEAGLAPAEVADGLERHAGLAGLSGTSGDLREIGAGTLAFDVYVHRLRREIIATQVVNIVVHGGGTTFTFRLHEESGAPASEIARCCSRCRVVRSRPLTETRMRVSSTLGSRPSR